MKKFSFPETAVSRFLDDISQEFEVIDLTPTITQTCSKAAYLLSWFDSLIVATALALDCNVLYTEDLQDGMVIEKQLKVVNPFSGNHP